MDWFKQNPLLGGIIVSAALATAAALYYVYSSQSELAVRRDEYASRVAKLRSIQEGRPFPDQAALQLAEQESAQAAGLLGDLEKAVTGLTAPLDSALTPQGFQDKLNSANQSLAEQAEARGVSLPEDFYLGFDPYRAQPPAGPAAPLLGQQLESINRAASLLVEARVKSITAVSRPPLASERGDSPAGTDGAGDAAARLVLAPFDIEFICEQSDFRTALGAIVSAEPMILVRLVSVTNSQPTGPAKNPDEAGAATGEAPAEAVEQIPVLFGQETVTVRLRLAAISGAAMTGEK